MNVSELMQSLRVGQGYDVHRFELEENAAQHPRPLILCAIKVESELQLLAHSDGDVVLHAVCDAILGAVGAGDIGTHFPDTDSRYRGISSSTLLNHVVTLARDLGWQVINADITVVAQVPKLSGYRPQMSEALAQLLGVAVDAANVKATTTERLGFEGREEGIACHAVVLMGRGDS